MVITKAINDCVVKLPIWSKTGAAEAIAKSWKPSKEQIKNCFDAFC